MRFILLILTLLTCSIWTAEPQLTPGADAALAKYTGEVAKAKTDMDSKVQVAKDALLKVLNSEMERLTRAGNLDGAIAIRSKMSDLTKNDPDTDLLGAVVAKDTAAAANTPAAADEPEVPTKIPSMLTFRPYNVKSGVTTAFMLGAFPRDSAQKDILTYIANGSFRKGYMGITMEAAKADGNGSFNCPDQDNSDTYWVIYVKAPSKDPVDVVISAKANPTDHTNDSIVFLDGRRIKPGVKSTITAAGHILIMKQMHKAAYRDASIRFLSETPVLVGAP